MKRIARGLAVAGGVLMMLGGQAHAATLVVSQTTDTPPGPSGGCVSGVSCSLREAVTDANDDGLQPGADTIQLPPGTYTLTNDALPEIPGDVTIEGTGGAAVTTITGATTSANANLGAGAVSVGGATAKLTIRDVTISGNTLTGTVPVGGGAVAGGGGATIVIERSVLRGNSSSASSANEGAGAVVSDGGSVTISDSVVEDNLFEGSNSPAAAGAVSVAGVSGVGLVISRSSISRNRVTGGSGPANSSAVGGVEVNLGTAFSVTDSTVSRNTVSFDGATAFRTGGIDTSSVPATTLTNVTVTDNVAAAGSGFVSHNISWFGGATTRVVRNSIVAGYAPNCFVSGPAPTSSGGNVEDANTCGFNGPGDLVNTNPDLGALRNNGGPGLTQLPLSSSPVLGLARPQFCSANDQRGVARPQGGACDSGAAEFATLPVNTTAPSISGTPASGQTLTCDAGGYTQAPALTFQWLSDGAAIAGATGSTFTVTDAQLDTAVQCRVTATNVAGATVSTSAAVVPPKPAAVDPPTPPVVSPPAPPANTVRPSFGGTLRTGKELTCSPGTFSNATSLAIAWLRNGTPIGGATAATYTLAATDAGGAIQCRVVATGPGGSAVAESAPAVAAKACIVPTLVGQKVAAARKRLTAANCAVGRTTKKKSKKKPGVVIASSPAKGTNLAAGTKVALTIAKK